MTKNKIKVKPKLQQIYDSEAVHETNLTFVMAGAVEYQLTQLDGMYKQQAKKWFTTWLNAARNLWVTLDNAMRIEVEYKDGKHFYSSKSSFLYDCNRILIDLPIEKHEAVRKHLLSELEKSLERKLSEQNSTNIPAQALCAELN